MVMRKILKTLMQALDPVTYAQTMTIAEQAITIDRLQMKVIELDLYRELSSVTDEIMFGMAMRGHLWEPNDVY